MGCYGLNTFHQYFRFVILVDHKLQKRQKNLKEHVDMEEKQGET
jgi:hypothetical protein